MAKYILVIFFLISSVRTVLAQTELPFRKPYRLVVYIDSTKYYGQDIDSTPFFGTNNLLQLFTGEQVFIEVETNGKKIVSMKSVSGIRYPEKTIVLELEQKSSVAKSESISLVVTNPFKRKLVFNLEHYDFNLKDWITDTPFTIGPKNQERKVWKDQIVITVLINEWKLE